MIPVRAFEGKDVAVFGLGRSGIATCRALMAGGARVCAWDDNEAARKAAEAAGVPLVDLNRRDWQTFAALVLSPGIPFRFPSRIASCAWRSWSACRSSATWSCSRAR